MQPHVGPLSILLLEDSSDDVFFFLRSVEKIGAAAVHVTDGHLAKQLLIPEGSLVGCNAAALPSVIVTDLKMPRCDGIDFVKWLRAQSAIKDIPIIVLSSSPRPGDQDRAIAAGANGYLVKPCDPLEDGILLQSILRMVGTTGDRIAAKPDDFPVQSDWLDLAQKISGALEAEKARGADIAYVSPSEAREMAAETIATVLHNEELDGRLHRGPAPEV